MTVTCVDFETPRPDLPVHFLNFDKPWLTTKWVLYEKDFDNCFFNDTVES